VRIYDPAGNEAIVLPIVDAVVSWRTLLHAELRLHSLAIEDTKKGHQRAKLERYGDMLFVVLRDGVMLVRKL